VDEAAEERRRAREVEARCQRALTEGLRQLRPDARPDGRGYVELGDNLLPGVILADIEGEFRAGAGQELAAKMRAPWSSSALAVNSFTPWRPDPGRLRLGGLSGFRRPVRFEAPCPNGVSRISPHLDVLVECGERVVGVESKCLEHVRGTQTPAVSPRYLRLRERGDPRAWSRWFAALEHVGQLVRLDGYQLVKHVLGLQRTFPGSPLTLVYLFWEPSNGDTDPLFAQHRREIGHFAELVRDDPNCQFLALSYAEHWRELGEFADSPPWLGEHLGQLRRRYLVEI
jgi:hypothetical protein